MTSRNAVCPCGSGKKFKRCCGLDNRAQTQHSTDQLFHQAIQLQQQGKSDNAINTCQLALKQAPKHAMGHALLAQILASVKKKELAEQHFSAAIKLGLSDPVIFFDYGNLLLLLDKACEAIKQFNNALKLNKNLLEAHINLGNVYLKSEQFDKAEHHYRKAIEIKPNYWKSHAQLATSLSNLTRNDEAIDELDIAIRAAPDNVSLYIQQANLKEQNNKLEEAEQLLIQAQAIAPDALAVKLLDSSLKLRSKDYPSALQALSDIQIDENDDNLKEFAANLANQRGVILDKLNSYDKALINFQQANRLMMDHRDINFDPHKSQRYFSDQSSYFTPEKYVALQQSLPDYAALELTPIFIVGFPRSGTTLVEQIIGSHPKVIAAGELLFISKIQDRLEQRLGSPYPQCLDKITIDNNHLWTEMRQFYIDEVNKLNLPIVGKNWICDKMPTNLYQLPLIHLLFPESALIHTLRHPMDSALSCFFQLFESRVLSWSFDLNDTISFFEHAWQYASSSSKQLNLPVHALRYESLVNEPQPEVESLLSHIGASWNNACLEFYNNNRVARTASYAQINQPIYKDSHLRYLNYAPYLDKSIFRKIASTTKAMGYTLED